jgi:hypothetical protein
MDEEEETRLAQTAQIAEYVRVVLRGYAIADGNADHVLVRFSMAFIMVFSDISSCSNPVASLQSVVNPAYGSLGEFDCTTTPLQNFAIKSQKFD